jgi:small subunit ribosomal protein S8e
MALWQGKSQRSKSGRRIRYARGKRRFEIGRETHLATIGPMSIKKNRIRGNQHKFSAKTIDTAYVVDPETNKTQKAEIKSVVDNPANINYIRRNIITKGAVIDTNMGKAKVTSRPGQVGMVNAILLKNKE